MPETQYFTNIDGKYVKDAEARQQLSDLEDYVESLDQPWQPLEDGYSNFWFELTNDTLSPWLNFSAKNDNAVIDWGDGSGEQALTTLTPTHTYSKAGRYVVKVKGVTSIARQLTAPYDDYSRILKNVELNSEVTALLDNAFRYNMKLENAVWSDNLASLGAQAFQNCVNIERIKLNSALSTIYAATFINCDILHDVEIAEGITGFGNSTFNSCISLIKITIPSTVTSFGNTVFANLNSIEEIHMKSTTPPTLGTNVFTGAPSNYIIYVPVGYGDTYKSAEGWSSYADHIVEEGQSPNRMMLAKFNDETDEPQDDMR